MLTKVIYSANGTLTDITAKLQDYYAGTHAFTFSAAQDKIYIGSKYPFARKYFKVSAANAVTANATVRYWDGNNWRAAAQTVDETATSGKPLANSGYISIVPDKRYGWTRADTNDNGTEVVTGLGGLTIYDMYWLELTFSGSVAATLSWFGDLFCTDNDLAGEYPSLGRANVKTAYKTGKTDWEEQCVIATSLVVADLKKQGITPAPGKLLDVEQLRRPATSKTAEVIFSGMGEGSADSAEAAGKEYTKRMSVKLFDVDLNDNGRADPNELTVKIARMTR